MGNALCSDPSAMESATCSGKRPTVPARSTAWTTSPNFQAAQSISPDSRTLVFVEGQGPGAAPDRDLYLVSLEGGPAEVLLNTEFNEQDGRISPDGRWLAYRSNESGRDEVYVRPFPDVESGRWQVSTAGGNRAEWGPDGRELFYLSADLGSQALS